MTSLKSLLRESSMIVGLTTQHVTHGWLPKLWKCSGCDFVYVEYEHGFFNERELSEFILACRTEGLPVVAKVPELSRTHVAKLLESGVIGIQLPWTETEEQINRLVSYIKFPPDGIRAAAPGYGNCDYHHVDGAAFLAEANRETVVIAHIETRTGVENADAILSNMHVDVAFIGLYDLSVSYGHPGAFGHPDIGAAIERIIASGRRNGKVIGMYVPDAEMALKWNRSGIAFFETASEVDLIAQGASSLIRSFRRSI